MATTSELIDRIVEQCTGWNRDGYRGVLQYLDIAQKMLFMSESEQNVVIDPLTGNLPPLNTTKGVFAYDLPADCWKLGHIGIEVKIASIISGTLLTTITGLDYGTRRQVTNPLTYFHWAGFKYVRVPYVRSWPAGDSTLARLVFTADPGDATDYYRSLYWRKPANLISDSIPLEIEPPWDDAYLLPATVALIHGVENGNYAEARALVLNELRPTYWKQKNSGEQGFSYEPVERGF
jgi:hypothetical protein